MRHLSLAAALIFVATEAAAINRYDPTQMSCAEVQAAIEREGAVILRYASGTIFGLPRYDRYVSGHSWCAQGEVVRSAGVPSADTQYCRVKKCVTSDIFVDG